MEQSAVAEAPTHIEEAAPPDKSADKIFRYSDWVHIGPGAEECERRETGCKDADHFHAWVRLPNKFQVTAIREKAQAARARVLRQARDEETDRFAIIENQLAEARAQGPEGMIEELTARNSFKWTQRAMQELAEDDDEGEESKFANVEEDQQRWMELKDTPEESRDEDEYQELTRHLEAWNDAVEARFAELKAPEQESLEGRTDDELVELLREQVIGEQANQIFMRVFSKWEWAICTLAPNAKGQMERVFPSLASLEGAAPEVIATLEGTFNALEQELNERSALRAEGN